MTQPRALIAGSLSAILAVGALAAACGGGADKATGPGSVASVVVTPDTATMVAGATQAFTAQAENASGTPVAGATIVWASADTTIATVDTAGTVAARAPGSVKIAASSQGVTGYATITVTARPVASVTISPNPASVPLNASAILTATLKDSRGDTLAGQTVVWTSSNANVSVTTSTGQTQVVTGVSAGSATITAAAASGVSGTVLVTVTNPVAFIQVTPNPLKVRTTYTVQSTAQAFDAGSNLLTGVSFAWTTKSGGTTASINATTGLVTGVAAGTDSVFASAGGKKGGTPTTVLADSVKMVTVTPQTATITLVQAETLSVALADSTGAPITAAVAWTSSPAGRVSATSGTTTIVTPQAGDTATGIVVTATSEGKTGHSTITVTHSTVASITLSPSPGTVTVGGSTLAITATLKDANGNTLSNRLLTWSASNATATVSGTGETGTVTAVTAGTDTITATSSDGPSATDIITVQNPPAPGIPTGVSATLSGAAIQIQWSGVTGATQYEIFRGLSSGGEGGTPIATQGGSTLTDNTVSAGTTYYYYVEACNLGGCSGQSMEVSATTPPPAPNPVTATPSGVNPGEIDLAWPAATGATSYNVLRGLSSGTETLVTTVGTPGYSDTGLASGTPYFYIVQACDVGGTECTASTEVSATAP